MRVFRVKRACLRYSPAVNKVWFFAKTLEGVGMFVVLAGLLMSIHLGLEDQSLASMKYEGTALMIGGGMFFVGWLIERSIGAR